jgi:serine/threonine-protein kinase
MDTTAWSQIKTIFYEASALKGIEREEYINKTCKDPELKKEIISLLFSHDKADQFLEIPSLPKEIIPENNDIFIGKYFGKYHVEKFIARGGMGMVYLGVRDDEVRQTAAIKIINPGAASETIIKRFQNERQTLANLNHPKISRLLDGGVTVDGIHFLIMEFIDGVPITEYCDNNKLSINERLKLFLKITSAVQYAHQSLVIHRDLKPSNILVTKDGEPKLLDFGIAKILDPENDNEDLTRLGIWNFTPEYASPEQIKGEAITTASDVYSLGIILYKLLTGCNPYKIKSVLPADISRNVFQAELLKPSEITSRQNSGFISKVREVSIEKYQKKLRGDLDNIILTAIRKEPERRYSSVQFLAEDIKSYLDCKPVNAYPDSFNYRSKKFIQRHKIGFAATVLIFLITVAGIVSVLWYANAASKERDKAQYELTKYEEISNFLLEMLASADPGIESKDVKVLDLLEKASNDIEVRLQGNPEIRSSIKQTLGSTFVGLGEYAKAETLLTESLESSKKLFGYYSKETGKSSHQLGLCYDWVGNFTLADSFYRQGITIFEKISETEKKPLKNLADNLNDYGSYLTNLGDYDSSTVLFKRALDIYKIHEEKNKKYAVTINNLAVNYHYQNKFDEAEKYYLEAQKILTNLYGINRPEIGSIFNNLAYIYLDNEDFEASEKAFQKSYEIKIAALGDTHPSVGLALVNIGMMNFVRKDYMRAEPPLLNAINFFHNSKALKDPVLSLGYYWLGCVYLESGKLDKAEIELKNSLRIREEIYPENNHRTWSTKGELGICFLKQKRYTEAEKLLAGSLNFYKNDKNQDMKKIERYTEYAAILYEEMGDKLKADFYKSEMNKLSNEDAQSVQ